MEYGGLGESKGSFLSITPGDLWTLRGLSVTRPHRWPRVDTELLMQSQASILRTNPDPRLYTADPLIFGKEIFRATLLEI